MVLINSQLFYFYTHALRSNPLRSVSRRRARTLFDGNLSNSSRAILRALAAGDEVTLSTLTVKCFCFAQHNTQSVHTLEIISHSVGIGSRPSVGDGHCTGVLTDEMSSALSLNEDFRNHAPRSRPGLRLVTRGGVRPGANFIRNRTDRVSGNFPPTPRDACVCVCAPPVP